MPLSADVIAALDALRRPGKGPKQLLVDARRNGLGVTQADVRDYFRDELDDKGREQLHQEMPYRGKTASEGEDARWQADLAIYPVDRMGFMGFL